MNKVNETTNTVKVLKTHYFLNIIFLVAFFLLTLFNLTPFFTNQFPVSITLERYVIIITMLVIPLSLKYFSQRLKKIQRPAETNEAIQKYKSAFSFRLYSLSILTLLHIVLFSISRNTNFLWFTVVLFIVFLYCKPSQEELISLMEMPEPENSAKDLPENSSENVNNDKTEKGFDNLSENSAEEFENTSVDSSENRDRVLSENFDKGIKNIQ